MVWMSEDMDVTSLVVVLEGMFSVAAGQGQSLGDLLVHNDVDFDTTFRGSKQHSIEPVLLVLCWWSPEVQFGAEPPIEDPDALSRVLEGNADGPHVRAAVHIPLGVIALALGSE